MRRHAIRFFCPICLLLLGVALTGCQKVVRGLDLGSTMYTKRHTVVRAMPDRRGEAVATIGVNVRVLVSRNKDGYSYIDVDNGHIDGWVESASLSPTPVRERARSRRRRPVVKSKPAETPKSTREATPAAATPQPATSPAPAPAATPAAETPPAAASPQPAPAPAKPSSSGSFLSPAEAQAATIPPTKISTPRPTKKKVPVKGKQAQPEAFDPF